MQRNPKTRDNYTIGACFKPCKHKGTKVCDDECIRFSMFEPIDDVEIIKHDV